jgi:hypothetical protein
MLLKLIAALLLSIAIFLAGGVASAAAGDSSPTRP